MAYLKDGGFTGFLYSMKETGRKLGNGAKELVENFISGFGGHGWKLWEYVKGKWKLEIDTIVVRETMLVFETLISKIRAIIGAQAITQGHGKVKSARISEDATEYLIELEDDNVSIEAHDFIRCQTFTGGNAKLYHVEVASVDLETKILHIPITEFESDESGMVINAPAAGDELVQFGNSQNKARQSAIYLHADESGQPAIDVMFDIDSKTWEGKVKIRLGAGIPGTQSRGFYVENGMIKGVDSTGHVTYCIYPDGSAEFGDGSVVFYTDKSGSIAGGAIAWQWDESNHEYVCTMKDVVLTWENLSDEVKENLKGEPGQDANLLPWIKQWNGYATELGEEYIVAPKMFSGVRNADGTLTGVAQGRDCITIRGKNHSGIYGLKNGNIVFSIDDTGEVSLTGKFSSSANGRRFEINPDNQTLTFYESDGQEGISMYSTDEGTGRMTIYGRKSESANYQRSYVDVDGSGIAATAGPYYGAYGAKQLSISNGRGAYAQLCIMSDRNNSNNEVATIQAAGWATSPNQVLSGCVYVENGFLKVKS